MAWLAKGLSTALGIIGKGIGVVNKIKPVTDLAGGLLDKTGLGRKVFGTKNWNNGYKVYNSVSSMFNDNKPMQMVNSAQNSISTLNRSHVT